MGSDWIWVTRLPAAGRRRRDMVATLISTVCERGFRLARPDGRYNLWTDIGDHVVVDHSDDVVEHLSNGSAAGQFWLDGSIDLMVSIDWTTTPGYAYTLCSLDSTWTRPLPGSPRPWLGLRNLITSAWIDAADRLQAEHGQVVDDWTVEWLLVQAPELQENLQKGRIPGAPGWLTYLGSGRTPFAALPDIPELRDLCRPTPGGGLLVCLIQDDEERPTHNAVTLLKAWTIARR